MAADAGGASLADQLFPGKGEMARLIRSTDWAKTPLGPVEAWPQSLRTAVSICLGSRHPIVLWWGPERWMFYNDAYRPMLGGSKHPQFLGASGQACWAEIWHVIGPMMDQVIATGEATWSENLFLLMMRHGYLEETYFTFSYSPILDEAGRPSGIFNACTESTGRVLGDRRMKTLRELTVEARTTRDAARLCGEILGNNAQDIPFALVYLLDRADRRFHLAGQAGLAPGTAASPPSVPATSPDAGGWPLGRVAASGRPELLEDLAARFDALPREPWDEPAHQAMLLPLEHPGWAEPAGILVLGISPRRAFDEDYRGFFGLVVSRVASAVASARAYELERERAEALAELDRAKTTFFSNVSHEFRTPLTLILGPLEDALRDPDRALRGEALQVVHRSAVRLLKLVNSLLDFSRAEAGRLVAAFEPTDLSLLTAGVAGAFMSLVEGAGLELVVECPPLSEPVYVDPSHWEKIVLNLVSNAFKFTFEGRITVRLQDRGDHVELAVGDTGTGIPSDEMPRVFERFHRVQGARGRSFEGTGIGLALVQELVRQNGGTVRLESTVGRGSTFFVAVPKGKAHVPEDRLGASSRTDRESGDRPAAGRRIAIEANARPHLLEATHWAGPGRAETASAADGGAAPSAGAREGQGPRARVLVVDDNADMREYLTRLLAPHYDVEVAPDGRAALDTARQRPPDLVLSDMMMPQLDGVGLLRALRARDETRDTPVVLLSARAGEEAVVAGLETGADDYLSKPFSSNELIARVRTHLDMSLRRRAWAQRLEALNEDLRRALVEAQAARQEAVAASRAKSEFLAAMSHEIRTPLNAVIGFSSLLAEHELTERQHGFAVAIRSSGDHLLGVLDDILDFSKLQSGHFELAPAPFALRPTLEAALDFVAGKAAEKELDLAYVMGPEVPAGLEADEARVRQILINYLGNAVKFTPRGEVVLRVESTALEDGRHEFHFAVRDTGIGIPADRMGRLFQDFVQADASIARQFGGTGLGLAISRKLAELQGGRVWAESTEGAGSTFHLAIPAAVRPEVGTAAPRSLTSLRGLRALVIDDNATNVDILRAQTESWGMRVRATEKPAEALAWLERGETFDLIVTDHAMPGMDGVTLAQRVRAVPGCARVPIVLFTSLSRSVRIARESGSDFAAVLTKPIRQSDLFNRICELLTPPVPAERQARPDAIAVPPLSVLLVEDNLMNQKVGLVLLEKIGYVADLASDGAESLEALQRKPYDVILMDMQMPRLDGLEATRAIRARGSSIRQPRIIAMTANALRGDRDACLAAGMDDYISKPIDRKELAAALLRASLALEARGGAPRPGSAEASEVDLATLADLDGAMGRANVDALLDLFTEAAPRRLAALRGALERGDAAALADEAHQLRSNALTLGAGNLGRILEQVEAAARAGILTGCDAKVNEIARRLPSALSELGAARRERT